MALARELIIRANAYGANFDVIINSDDTLKVKDGTTGITTEHPAKLPDDKGRLRVYNMTVTYGNPPVVTVERGPVAWKRGHVYQWSVYFAMGGYVRVWGTRTYEQSRPSWRRDNERLDVYIRIPTSLRHDVSGLCGRGTCTINPKLPYNWCQGDPNCLPTKVEETLHTPSELHALESACSYGIDGGIAVGASQRPNTCVNRTSEVDCGFVSGVGKNLQNYMWPKNLGIR